MGLCLPVPVARVKLKLDDALDGMNRSVVAKEEADEEFIGETLSDDANDAANDVGPISLMGEATPVITDVRFRGEEEADKKESTERPPS
jgi:hypothetical protein